MLPVIGGNERAQLPAVAGGWTLRIFGSQVLALEFGDLSARNDVEAASELIKVGILTYFHTHEIIDWSLRSDRVVSLIGDHILDTAGLTFAICNCIFVSVSKVSHWR